MDIGPQVLSESMRLYPPIPLHIGRRASREVEICGMKVPQGTAVLSAVWSLHHDPAFWPEPWQFRPDRDQ